MAAEPGATFQLSPPAFSDPEEEWRTWAEGLLLSRTLGIRCVEIAPGSALLSLETSPWPMNPNGSVHGGLLAALADQALGIVACTAYDGRVPSTSTLSAEYFRPARPPLLLRSRVAHEGRSFAFVTVDIED